MEFHLEHHIAELLLKSFRGELSDSEREELYDWKSGSPEREALFSRVQDDEYIERELAIYIQGKKKNPVLWEQVRKHSILRKRRKLVRLLSWGSAAACISFLFGISFLIREKQEVVPVVSQTVSPGSYKAILLTDNGKTIELSDSSRLMLGQGILAVNNQLDYVCAKKESASEYHTLKIPRGGEYRLKLSDGTTVFLNSDSELRYPVNFGATSREVELKGEAFFEVTKDAQRPFVVKAEQVYVKVLGTSFNINTYDKEYIETVLVQGSVGMQVAGDSREWRIKPNELASFNRKSKTIVVKEVDVLPYVAWKEGRFLFKNQSLEQITEIMARWYDINVTFQDESIKHLHFTGDLRRHEDFSVMLEALTSLVNVDYRLENRELILYMK